MCGDRRVVEGVKIEELFEDDGSNNAKEVDEIPLCARCVDEVIGDGKTDDEHLIPMALDRVEQFDGGLSRRRWEAKHAGAATCETSQSSHQPAEYSTRTPSPIYVNMHDPLGQPAFRRSPAKPVPSWMRYLPNQRQDRPVETEPPRPSSVLDNYFSPSESSPTDSDVEDLPPPIPPHKVLMRPKPPTYTPVQMSRPFTLMAEEPVQRPSSRLAPGRLPPSRHVHFNDGNGSPTGDTIPNQKFKSPSESSEYLETYPHPAAAAASNSTVNLPLSTLPRQTGSVSPSRWSRLGDIHQVGSSATDSDSRWKPTASTSTIRDQTSSSAEHQYTVGKKRQVEGRSSHHEHAYSPNASFYTGGGDGVFDIASSGGSGNLAGRPQQPQRRPVTFQDQLKRMFGFT